MSIDPRISDARTLLSNSPFGAEQHHTPDLGKLAQWPQRRNLVKSHACASRTKVDHLALEMQTCPRKAKLEIRPLVVVATSVGLALDRL